jgi:hypothetical protein
MPETIEPVAAPVTTDGEISVSDPAALDAILNSMRGAPPPVDDGAGAVGALPDKPVVEPVAPVAPPPAPAPAAPAPPVSKEAVVDDPFTPPPSVMGEQAAPAAAVAEDDPYGTMPEAPPASVKSEKGKSDYAKWRESHERLKTDLIAAREEIKTRPAQDPGLLAQIADLTKRNAEQNAIIERKWSEELPYVKTTFDAPREAAVKDAQHALTLAKIDPAALTSILSLPEADRIEALDEIYGRVDSEFIKKKLGAAIDRIDKADAEKAAFLADREGNTRAITEAERAEQSRRLIEQEKNLTTMVDGTIDHFADKLGFEFLKKSGQPGYEKWDARVDADRALIHELAMQNKDPQRFVAAITAGVSAPHYRMAWQNQLKANVELKAEIAKLKGVVPSLNGKPAADPAAALSARFDADMIAAGITPADDLATQSRKLGSFLSSRQ